MTMDRVRMALKAVFAPGMAYVALSRCRSLAGIQLDNFAPHGICADPRALAFYERLPQMVAAALGMRVARLA